MTRSHAKHNTTQSTLTHYERTLLRRQNEGRRLGHDSFKPLDHCNLCLSNVYDRDPVSCPKGHIYCKECVLTNLISQKASIEASKRELERWEDNEIRDKLEARQKARERVISDFEKGMGLGQGGISGRKPIDVKDLANGNGHGNGQAGGVVGEEGRRTFEKLQQEAEERALKIIEEEQLEARKSKLAAFWLPSLTPEAKLGPVKDMKLQTMCHVGGEQHPISRKTILPVIFTYPPGAKPSVAVAQLKAPKPICPSCSRDLSNSNHSILLSSRSPPTATTVTTEEARPKKKSKKEKEEPYVCGHVVCKSCADSIVKESGRCCVCEASIGEDGMIPLGKEGTGFAAAGGAEVKRNVTTFRV